MRRRDVEDIVHKVVAVGSRTVQKAQEFINKYTTGGDLSIKAYGTYAEVYADKVRCSSALCRSAFC